MSRILIVGGGASGKDTLRKRFEEKGYKFGIYCTSRPARQNETCNDYDFVSDTLFKLYVSDDRFIEYQYHNEWGYGLLKKEFESKNIFIISPLSFSKLDPKLKKSSFCILMDIQGSKD